MNNKYFERIIKMTTENKTIVTIDVQATIALMLIQLVHKIVREIPHSLDMGGAGAIVTPVMAIMLAVGIGSLLLKAKWGLVLGVVDGIWMIFQPILVHIILAQPDINGIWWYPIFPWTQAILMIYFCRLAWKNWK
jgi:hypothetical protein